MSKLTQDEAEYKAAMALTEWEAARAEHQRVIGQYMVSGPRVPGQSIFNGIKILTWEGLKEIEMARTEEDAARQRCSDSLKHFLEIKTKCRW